MTRVGAVLLLGFAMIAGLRAPAMAEEKVLEEVAVERHPDAIAVRIRVAGGPRYKAQWLDRPPRILVDLEETRYAWKVSRLSSPVEPVKEIRGTQLRAGTARVVLELSQRVDYRIDADADGLRVVLGSAGGAAAPAPGAQSPAPAPPEKAPPGPRLQGIVHGNHGWVAYIEDPQSRRVGPYRVGDTLGGAVVERIEAESVTLSSPQGPTVLELGEGHAGRRPKTR